MNPVFSIISPSYNKAAYILDMIESVLHQTEKSWELIIIDDASTDTTKQILQQEITKDDRIKVFFNTDNNGANFCRNQGIKSAKGAYIIFFDADDIMAKFCLEARRKAIQKTDKQSNLWIFSMGLFNQKIGDTSTSKNWVAPNQNDDYLSKFLNHSIPWSIMQSVWDSEFLRHIGGFDLAFLKFQDLEIHTTALLSGAKVTTFNALPVDVFYRIDERRKTFNPHEFQTRIVESSVKYYNKFYEKVPSPRYQRKLSGTLFQPLSALCWQLQSNNITKTQFLELKSMLIENCNLSHHRFLMSIYQRTSRIFPFHVPGLKKLFTYFLGVQ